MISSPHEESRTSIGSFYIIKVWETIYSKNKGFSRRRLLKNIAFVGMINSKKELNPLFER
jgi:hypothetical protein